MTLALTTSTKNLFLSSLSEPAALLLQAHLKPVKLDVNDTIYNQDDPIEEVYFPLDCVISTVVIMSDGATIEVTMLGREGVVGVNAALGDDKARHWTRPLIPGAALAMPSQTLNSLYLKHAELQAPLLAAYRAIITQVSQRAVCNGRHTLQERLATWLLMVHDRVGADELRLTQDMIAQRLGSRRAGVTEAAQALHRMDAISYKRGHIEITDPSTLERVACECYQTHKTEFYGASLAGRLPDSLASERGKPNPCVLRETNRHSIGLT